MTTERRTIPLRKLIMSGVKIGLVAAILLLQFRLLTICIVLACTLLFAVAPRLRCRRWIISASLLVVVTMLLPFDVALGSFHYGSRVGTSRGGPHLVEFVVGFPMHTRLIERYGEYISGGCSSPALYPPRWILVWS